MTTELITEMSEFVNKYGGENTTTHLMVQAIKELQRLVTVEAALRSQVEALTRERDDARRGSEAFFNKMMRLQADANARARSAVPSRHQIMAAAMAIHDETPGSDEWETLRQCEVDALCYRAEAALKAAMLAAAPQAEASSVCVSNSQESETQANLSAGQSTLAPQAEVQTPGDWVRNNVSGRGELVEALARQADAQGIDRCTSCDGTGDVTDHTGEWRGYCICSAALTKLKAQKGGA